MLIGGNVGSVQSIPGIGLEGHARAQPGQDGPASHQARNTSLHGADIVQSYLHNLHKYLQGANLVHLADQVDC